MRSKTIKVFIDLSGPYAPPRPGETAHRMWELNWSWATGTRWLRSERW